MSAAARAREDLGSRSVRICPSCARALSTAETTCTPQTSSLAWPSLARSSPPDSFLRQEVRRPFPWRSCSCGLTWGASSSTVDP